MKCQKFFIFSLQFPGFVLYYGLYGVYRMATEDYLYLEQVDSTNQYVRDHFDDLPDGCLVAAKTQTAGRGRLGRQWLSPPEENIYATWVIKQLTEPYLATAAGSLAVLETLREYAPDVNFFLKWPNDVYADHAKICGILTEGVTGTGNTLKGAAVGIGININSKAETFAGLPPAASLASLTGNVFFVKNVISALVKRLSACYITYLNAPDVLFTRWKTENRLIGRELEFQPASGEPFRAVFRDVLRTGEALLETETGVQSFSCGDVRILKESIHI